MQSIVTFRLTGFLSKGAFGKGFQLLDQFAEGSPGLQDVIRT